MSTFSRFLEPWKHGESSRWMLPILFRVPKTTPSFRIPQVFRSPQERKCKILCTDVLLSVCHHVLHSSHFLSTVHTFVNSEQFCLLKEQNCGIFCSNCEKNIKMIPLSALNFDAFQYFQNRQRWNNQKQSPNSCFKNCSMRQDNRGLPTFLVHEDPET